MRRGVDFAATALGKASLAKADLAKADPAWFTIGVAATLGALMFWRHGDVE